MKSPRLFPSLENTRRLAARLRGRAATIRRLVAENRLLRAKADYYEHDASCCGGCEECAVLYAAFIAAGGIER